MMDPWSLRSRVLNTLWLDLQELNKCKTELLYLRSTASCGEGGPLDVVVPPAVDILSLSTEDPLEQSGGRGQLGNSTGPVLKRKLTEAGEPISNIINNSPVAGEPPSHTVASIAKKVRRTGGKGAAHKAA